MTYSVGYFIGSLSEKSINRTLSKALIRLARFATVNFISAGSPIRACVGRMAVRAGAATP